MPLSSSVRLNTLLLLVLVLMTGAIIAVLAGRVYGGQIDPSGAPGSTMKSLDELPGSWDRSLDATNGDPGGGFKPAGCDSSRFKCALVETQCIGQSCFPVYNSVLDLETGLVWERTPSGPAENWWSAFRSCLGSTVGGHALGWRLPTISELLSLMDASTKAPPAGSPFGGVASPTSTYWSATTEAFAASIAYLFRIGISWDYGAPIDMHRRWCVRGPGGS